jgi:hypothetical protein
MLVPTWDLKYAHSALWGSPYLRMWRDGRPTMSIANSYRHGGNGDGTGAPPGWRQGRAGRKLPSSLNSREGMMKRRMKIERRGK